MAGQGETRLTGTSYAVLGLVRYLGRATPYRLKRLIAESVENFWPVPHTTFYAEPARLAQAGYLTEEQEPAGRRRKLYELTDKGRAALEEWVADTDVSPPQLRDEAVLKVFLGADPVRVFRHRLQWHRAKLRELEGYLAEVTGALAAPNEAGPDRESLEGAQASLIGGTAFHRMHIELIERGLADASANQNELSPAT
jgi:PadR family transcriptional regulator, regulatory protein AphA